MSHGYYSEINLHIVWHTKESVPSLIPNVEELAQQSIRDRVLRTPNVIFYEIGGTETHVHLAIRVCQRFLSAGSSGN